MNRHGKCWAVHELMPAQAIRVRRVVLTVIRPGSHPEAAAAGFNVSACQLVAQAGRFEKSYNNQYKQIDNIH